MSDQKKEYRNILKGTAIFGSVQVFQILISIVRAKFIAILLGPAGMGISALLTSTTNVINQFSSLGLGMGAVRDISMANEAGDVEQLSKIAKIFRRLIFITGILGALISVAGSMWWSEIAFGNRDYIWAFVILGAMLFFTAIASGESSLLQGTRRLKYLAKTSLIGSAVGLLTGIPLYYFFGTDGIAPAMLTLAATTYFSNRYFAKKLPLQEVVITPQETKTYAKSMIALGVALTAAAVIGTLSYYFINWFIRYNGGLDDVGLYQAATSITTQYIGLVFSAMAVDYFPRLAAISNDNAAIRKTANQQAEIVILVATPIIVALFATTPIVVRVLLSEEFMVVIPILRWMGLALFFKAASYALGYISFAKGDKRTFFWLEGILGNALMIVCSVIGYLVWGFLGLGIAMLGTYGLYFLIVSMVVIKKYAFSFEKDFLRLFFILIGSVLGTFLLSFLLTDYLWYGSVSGLIFLAVGYYCYRELDKRMQIKELIRNKFLKK